MEAASVNPEGALMAPPGVADGAGCQLPTAQLSTILPLFLTSPPAGNKRVGCPEDDDEEKNEDDPRPLARSTAGSAEAVNYQL